MYPQCSAPSGNASAYPPWFDTIDRWGNWYSRHVHEPSQWVLCLLGLACNLPTIAVLSRPALRSPFNTILIGMAVCNSTLLLSTLVFLAHNSLTDLDYCATGGSGGEVHGLWWAVFIVVHGQTAVVSHTSSIWMSVLLAFARLHVVRQKHSLASVPSRALSLAGVSSGSGQQRLGGGSAFIRCQLSNASAVYCCTAIVVATVLANMPNTLSVKLARMDIRCSVNGTYSVYVPTLSQRAYANHCALLKAAFWITGCAFKALPCLLLLVSLPLLSRFVHRSVRHRAKMSTCRNMQQNVRVTPSQSRPEPGHHTSRLLLMILCITLITELPQGVLAVLTGVLDHEFNGHVYASLGDVLDALSFVSALPTFAIYCSTSSLFRHEFTNVLRRVSVRMAAQVIQRVFQTTGRVQRARKSSSRDTGRDESLPLEMRRFM